MNTVMELEIGPGPDPGSYVVHVLQSVGGGEPTQTITLDLDELVDRRPLLEATVLSSSVSARRVMSDTEAVVQDVGRRLFDATFSGEVRSAFRTSMAVASERGSSVQIALRLTAPGLAALPWETLFDAEAGVYLCRKEPLVRHVPAPHSPPALSIEPPDARPRHDLLAARAAGARRRRRAERLEEALRPHLDSGRVELEWLDEVTWNGVHARLLEQEWHVLHFVGHGTYDVETDEGVLAFVGRDGRADYVTASSLADLLDEAEPTPRLVVLNSCQSGAGGTTDLFSGTAAALAHSGIRAVAAMQFSISDTAAIEFARGFYTALAHGRGIDEAVRSGRIGILGMGRGTLEWVTPVLYLRGEDAQLFDVAPMPATAPVSAPAAVATAASATTAASGPTAASTATAASAKPTPPETPPRTVPTPATATTRVTHTPDSGDLPSALLPVIRPEAAAAAGSAGMAAAAAKATAPRPFVMPPADAAKAGTPAPSVARTAPQPTVPAAPARPTTVTPPTTPPPSRTTPTTPMGAAGAATLGAATTPKPGSPQPPTPPGPPQSNRPSPAPPPAIDARVASVARRRAHRDPGHRRGSNALLAAPVGGSDEVAGDDGRRPGGPEPAATVEVLGTEAQWVSTGLSCNAGDTFELTAIGQHHAGRGRGVAGRARRMARGTEPRIPGPVRLPARCAHRPRRHGRPVGRIRVPRGRHRVLHVPGRRHARTGHQRPGGRRQSGRLQGGDPEARSTGVTRVFSSERSGSMDTAIELEIGPGTEPGTYVVRVLRSVGGGEPVETISLDVDELVSQRPHVEASILSSSVSTRRIMSDTEAAVQAVGIRLFDATFTGDIRTAYRTSAAVAAERGTGVQIALRLDAPGLAALPWEALFDSETQAYLCLKEPLVRHVPAPFSPPALTLSPPLKVLGMISSPAGLPGLDVEAERVRLEEALRPHLDAGRVELRWLDDASLDGGARQAPRRGVARAALHRPRRIRHRDR